MEPEHHAPRRAVLVAVLLNPVPHSRPTITMRNVEVAKTVVGADTVMVVNLHGEPTRDLPELAAVAHSRDGWRAERGRLKRALANAEHLLFAWGLGGLSGPARHHFLEQVSWTIDTAVAVGHTAAFMLDGAPRHPSRWRQYLGPENGRHAALATFEERLGLALTPVALAREGAC